MLGPAYIPKVLRPFFRKVVPGRVRRFRARRWRRDLEAATARLWELSGGRVLSGPFQGMRYLSSPYSQLGPKLLGTYEHELHHLIPTLVSTPSGHIVNVGAGEGYYACGLLRLMPKLRLTAFEQSERGRTLMEALAGLNGVRDRLTILGHCDREGLARVLDAVPRSPVLMDVEGAEDELLDPPRVPGLRHTPVLVETHDFDIPGVTGRLLDRFRPSHRCRRIPAVDPARAPLPKVPGFSRRELLLAAFERSAEDQEWLWMEPREAPPIPHPAS